MQGVVDRYLSAISAETHQSDTGHPDEDLLTAFVEGNLAERESAPLTAHLVRCPLCLHKSAELVRLGEEFSEDIPVIDAAEKPVKVADVLSGILGRIFGTGDDAVFAHQETEDDDDRKDPAED